MKSKSIVFIAIVTVVGAGLLMVLWSDKGVPPAPAIAADAIVTDGHLMRDPAIELAAPEGARESADDSAQKAQEGIARPLEVTPEDSEVDKPIPLSPGDIDALNAYFAEIYKGVSREDLLGHWNRLYDFLPSEEIHLKHNALAQAGSYTLVDGDYYRAGIDSKGRPNVRYTKRYQRDCRPLLDVPTMLADGTIVETNIKASDIPAYEQELLELAWVHQQVHGEKK